VIGTTGSAIRSKPYGPAVVASLPATSTVYVPAGSVTPQSLCEPSELSSHANRVAPAAS